MAEEGVALPLSVLDLAPVVSGQSEAQALRRCVDLARHVEGLGYTRFWVAEHHNMPTISSAAPDVLAGVIAASTERIRVGSGGVMLPNHSPLVVAERFATLEGLFPGRVDLGIGRAPGTDPRTTQALRRPPERADGGDFVDQIHDMIAFFDGEFPPGHPFAGIRAVPGRGLRPPLWLLGSSDFSAQLAAAMGQRFSYAYHFAPHYVLQAMSQYRQHFRPSADLARPYAKLTVGVFCADTEAEARRLSLSASLATARLRTGKPELLSSPEEVEAHAWTDVQRAVADQHRQFQVVGAPEQVAAKLHELARRTQADEIMVTAMIHDPAAHRRSFTLVAQAMGISKSAAVSS